MTISKQDLMAPVCLSTGQVLNASVPRGIPSLAL
jgi:hypothetical protein